MSDFEALRNLPYLFVQTFRMLPQVFDKLYEMVEPYPRPKRETQSAKRFYSNQSQIGSGNGIPGFGDLQRHLAFWYRISKQHFGRIVKDVCEVLCAVLKN